MKKLIFLCSIIMYCLSANAQTFTASPTTVASGADVTFKGSGENPTAYFSSLYSASLTPINTAVTFTAPTSIVMYNTSSQTATSFKMKFTNPTSSAQTVTVTFTCAVNNDVSHTQNTNYTTVVSVTVSPATSTPITNTFQSLPFTRNDCGAGYRGSTVYTSVQANQYTGATVGEANQKAIAYINAHGQANANATGTCDLLYPNPYMSQPFTKNNCGTGFTGSSVVYEVAAGKYYSINSPAGAISQAQNEINLNGQNNANSSGTCTPIITYVVGPTAVNGDSQHDYTLPNLPSNYTVTWSVNGPATIINGGNTATATIYFTPMPDGTTNGLVTVRVTISDGVNPPTTTIVKKINVTYCTVCP